QGVGGAPLRESYLGRGRGGGGRADVGRQQSRRFGDVAAGEERVDGVGEHVLLEEPFVETAAAEYDGFRLARQAGFHSPAGDVEPRQSRKRDRLIGRVADGVEGRRGEPVALGR